MTPEQRQVLTDAMASRETILISGGTGSGKTTLLNALAELLPDEERIVVIEDTAEIRLDKPNLVRFEARRAQADMPAVTIRDLVRASLRHRPDRLIIGEVRGAEAFDLLQALNTGHAGSLSTIHANSAAQALTRLVNCVLQADDGVAVSGRARVDRGERRPRCASLNGRAGDGSCWTPNPRLVELRHTPANNQRKTGHWANGSLATPACAGPLSQRPHASGPPARH